MLTIATSSPRETGLLAGCVAALIDPGDVLLLIGELGSGKTTFAKALGQALGVEEQMTSPTFTLAREYEGRLRVFHIDVYRLDHMSELLDLDLPDLLDSDGVVMIEWGDAIAPALPADYLEVRMSFGADDDDRSIELRPVGARWGSREAELADRIDVLGPHAGGHR